MQFQTPRRLIAETRSKLSAGSSAASDGGIMMPALLKAMSSRPKRVDGALDERGDLGLVGHVARDAERLLAGGGQLVGGDAHGVLVDVGEHDGGAGAGERAGGVAAHAASRAGDQRDLAVEVVGRVHGVTMTLIDSRSAIAR